MDVIRRNTDYALRLAASLASNYAGSPVSARKLAAECSVPYQLTCKLLQRLASAEIVRSVMGPAGGYELSRDPGKVSMKEVIETIQGYISLNTCFADAKKCPLKGHCPLHEKLTQLQEDMDRYFDTTTLGQLTMNSEQ